jgi:hypothetical protein
MLLERRFWLPPVPRNTHEVTFLNMVFMKACTSFDVLFAPAGTMRLLSFCFFVLPVRGRCPATEQLRAQSVSRAQVRPLPSRRVATRVVAPAFPRLRAAGQPTVTAWINGARSSPWFGSLCCSGLWLRFPSLSCLP